MYWFYNDVCVLFVCIHDKPSKNYFEFHFECGSEQKIRYSLNFKEVKTKIFFFQNNWKNKVKN